MRLRCPRTQKSDARRARRSLIGSAEAIESAGGRLIAIAVATMLIALQFGGQVQAASGDLDATFEGDGKLSTDFFGGVDSAFDLAVRPDGRIVVAGAAQNGDNNTDFAIAQYDSSGKLDPAFGIDGIMTIDFFSMFDQANTIALQPDGKIVIAGITRNQMNQSDFALARLNSDGSLDTSFGSAGKVMTDFFEGIDSAAGIALQPDGRIVVAGTAFRDGLGGEFAMARYNNDGSLDTSFGAGGKTTTDFSGLSDTAIDIAIMPDGHLVVAGQSLSLGRGPDFALARYNSDGSLDSDFGTEGKVTTDFSGASDIAGGLAVQADGRVIVAGGADNFATTGFDFALARYTTRGALDPSFGDGGKVTTHFVGNLDVARAIALQAEGRIVVAGAAGDSSNRMGADFALARYDGNGRLDPSFGAHGKVTTDFFGGIDLASAVALQADGKVMVGGFATRGIADNDFAIARYNATVEPDFAIAFEPETVRLTRGVKLKVKVRVDRVLGFDGPVTVAPQNAGALSIAVNPESISIGDQGAKFRLKARSSAPAGTHQLVFVGRDAAGRERSVTLTIEIR